MTSPLPSSFDELVRLDRTSQAHWFGLLLSASPDVLTADEHQWRCKITTEFIRLPLHDRQTLSEPAQVIRRNLMINLHVFETPRLCLAPSLVQQAINSDMQRHNTRAWYIIGYRAHLEYVLETCDPNIAYVHRSINAIINSTDRRSPLLDVPALLNSISVHLGLRPLFISKLYYTPSTEALVDRLGELFRSSRAAHVAMLQLLVPISHRFHGLHSADCPCPLCAHISNVLPQIARQFGMAPLPEATSM